MSNMFTHCTIVFALLIASICIDETLTADLTACGDWLSYQDEWCYKILDDTFRTFDEAVKSCAKLESSATLPIIRTKAEQDFLSNYLFKIANKVEGFWIGARYSSSSKKFQWIDKTELSFTNWDPKGVRGKADYCVQIQGDETVVGKWIDKPCDKKKNLVVCQRIQTWTLARLQKIVIDARKELRDSQEDARNHIRNLEQNPVPIGFVYVQLPGQPEPKSIWPSVGWLQITSNYAGQFFRAEGGGSAAFGNVQNGDSPRLVSVESEFLANHNTKQGTSSLTPGSWTSFVRSGGPGEGGDHHAIRFLVSNSPVRPINQAVRIWRRKY